MEKKTSFARFVSSTFIRGFLGILPLTVSIYVVIWVLHSFTGMTDRIVSTLIPFFQGVPGIGLLVGLTIIFLLGLLFSSKKFSDFFTFLQIPFKNIPLVKTVYSAIEDMMFYFSSEAKNKGKVVLVKLPSSEVYTIGLLTRDDLSDIKTSALCKDHVAVFIPMSYALGGYTIFVPRSSVTLTDLPVDSAMKSALTAWMKKENGENP